MNGKLGIVGESISEHRTVRGEDIKSILEGTLYVLQIYIEVLNAITPRTMLEKAMKDFERPAKEEL